MLNPGTKLGPYEILSPLGAGGMGEVYLANDSKLDRQVAIKVLPDAMTRDVERIARFEREAKVLASLNHPNIAAIHGFDDADGTRFLVMEYVEGDTLAQRLRGGAFAVEDALDIAKQMTEALEAAHDKGVIHRDLKPANVMIREDGSVKVLDFGLAKATGDGSDMSDSDCANSPTITANFTRPGVVLGTAAYMSPEQARGRPLDKRTDIWSFGVVLFECLAGASPFSGETATDVIAKIMERDPDYDALPERTPRRVRELLRRCLEKHSKRRLRDIGDAMLELDQSLTTREWSTEALEATNRGMRRTWPARIAVGTAVVLIMFAAAYSGWHAAKRSTPAAPKRINARFTKLTDQMGAEFAPSLSPDAKTLVYMSLTRGSTDIGGKYDIYSMRVGGSNATNLTAKFPEGNSVPVFSPDGERIAFRSERQGGGLFVMGATGESPRRLTDFGFSPAWHPDGKRVLFATEGIITPDSRQSKSALWSVMVETGETTKVFDGDAVEPSCSPGGHRIAYWTNHKGGQRDLFTIPAGGGDPVAITDDAATDWHPIWSPDGRYLYFCSNRGGSHNIWRVPIDERTGERLGDFEPITSGVAAISAHASVASDGNRIAYSAVVYGVNIYKVAFDPETETVSGEPIPVTRQSTPVGSPDVSPDGKRLAVVSGGNQEDLYILNTDGTDRRRLTNDTFKDRGPRWSPDGKRIAFYSDRGGKYAIWSIHSDGSGLEVLIESAQQYNLPVWSPSGSRIAAAEGATLRTLVADLTGDDGTVKFQPLSDEAGNNFVAGSWSADGTKLLGFLSTADGSRGIGTYSIDTGLYELIVDEGGGGQWLSDSQRFVFVRRGNLFLADSVSKEVTELLSVSPGSIGGLSIAPGDREIYFSISTFESDVWLAELE